ncbi:MAG: hypothetical protein AABY22_08125 [Nanoarchaeota archaeon]
MQIKKNPFEKIIYLFNKKQSQYKAVYPNQVLFNYLGFDGTIKIKKGMFTILNFAWNGNEWEILDCNLSKEKMIKLGNLWEKITKENVIKYG